MEMARQFSLSFNIFVILICEFLLSNCKGVGSTQDIAAVLATKIPITTAVQQIGMQPAIPENRMLSLEYPRKIRIGDSDFIRLTLELDENGRLTPTLNAKENVAISEVKSFSNLYETHNIFAEANLDMAGMDIRPSDTISETLLPGQKITFYWSVLPSKVGIYRGTIWFYLRFFPKSGGTDSRQALSAQPIEIEATSFFGLKSAPVRWLGVAGFFISLILGLPYLKQLIFWVSNKLHSKNDFT